MHDNYISITLFCLKKTICEKIQRESFKCINIFYETATPHKSNTEYHTN